MKRADGPVGGKAEYAGVIETDVGGGRSIPICNGAWPLDRQFFRPPELSAYVSWSFLVRASGFEPETY